MVVRQIAPQHGGRVMARINRDENETDRVGLRTQVDDRPTHDVERLGAGLAPSREAEHHERGLIPDLRLQPSRAVLGDEREPLLRPGIDKVGELRTKQAFSWCSQPQRRTSQGDEKADQDESAQKLLVDPHRCPPPLAWAYGRDATDCALTTSFGRAPLAQFEVHTNEVKDLGSVSWAGLAHAA